MAGPTDGDRVLVGASYQLPGIDRVLRLAKRVTGHEYAGVVLSGLGPVATDGPSTTTLDLDDRLVAATLDRDGVRQEHDLPPTGPFALRSYAGVRLCTDNGTLGVLWTASTTPRVLDASDVSALADLGALLEADLDRSGNASLAAEVQRQLLPDVAPPDVPLDMAADCRPAQEVGGDFYDWWCTGDTLQVVVADVMGKGVPAAIVASAIRAMLRAALTFNTPAVALRRVGGDLQSDLDQVARFATCFATRLDLTTFELTFVDAGHGLALILRDDGTVTHLRGRGVPLGVLPDATWHEQHDVLGPGEMLLIVSDGVLDLFESTKACVERARAMHLGGARAADYVSELVPGLATGRHTAEPGDDLTVVAIGRPAT